jgi:Flp pilus assembly protein TadD
MHKIPLRKRYVLKPDRDRSRPDLQPAAEEDAAVAELTPEEENRFQALTETAAIFHSEGRLHDASRAWGRALEIKPRDADTWANHGTTYFALNDFENAAKAYRMAHLLDPDNPFVVGNLAAVIIHFGWYEEAERLIRDFILRQERKSTGQEYQPHPLLLINLASALALQDKPLAAIEYLDRAADQDPGLVRNNLDAEEFQKLKQRSGWDKLVLKLEKEALTEEPE